MKHTSVTLLLLLFCTVLCAQSKKLLWQGTVQAGLLEGEKGGAFQLNAAGGIKTGTWVAAVGAGFDYYHTRTVPLFFNLRKDLYRRKKTPFVYASAGYNFPWLREIDKMAFEEKHEGGFYGDAGIGYQFPVLKTEQLFFSLGFSQKRFSRTYNSMPYISIWPPPPQAMETYNYVLNRVSITTGLRF